MSLSERLRLAKGRRDGGGDIDLTAAEAATELMETEHTAPPARFGFPTSCPECGGRGYLDRVDLVDRVQFQHCVACGAQWQLAEAELTV